MVFICPQEYTNENYTEYFQYFSFELSNWQKWSLQSMIDGNHSLVTAPTGSGKTLPAEFSIRYFHSKKKKIIYTSPIKALSNQKYHEFSKKYPDISFGILTGDIKDNPEADVLIMTTEILRNNLYQKKYDTKNLALDFNIDIETEVGVVIFDEVHYINDQDRGTVWEECFMLMPACVQLLMLSATIDKPEKFAEWIEKIHKESTKQVFLSTTNIRFVPLEHYLWLGANAGIIKNIKDKEFKEQFNKNKNKLHLIKTQNKPFDELTYHKINKYITYIKKNNLFVARQHVLNELTSYLKQNEMIPAIYFVYSRANVEKYANDITISMFSEDEETYPQIIDKECRQILSKLPNYEEYLHLPEYVNMIKLFQKGIGIHHSGIMPVLREMVEILFEKRYIKLLFATETFAVGLNMPTKTVVFTNLSKFDGGNMRYLQAHEYTQQAGRAGRRGFDEKGIVIHLSNLFEYPFLNDYKKILGGVPQTLVSKFKISYNLLLNLYFTNNFEFSEFANNSMITNEIQKNISSLKNDIQEIDNTILKKKDCLKYQKTSLDIIHKYFELDKNRQNLSANKKKKVDREINQLLEHNKDLKNDTLKFIELDNLETDRSKVEIKLKECKEHINNQVKKVETILSNNNFISNYDENSILEKGKIAAQIKELHCLVFAELLEKFNYFQDLEYYEIAAIFSLFTNVSVLEDYRDYTPKTNNYRLKEIVLYAKDELDRYQNLETQYMIFTGSDYNIIYDLIDYIIRWCKEAIDEQSCKKIIQEILEDKNIFLGEFVKAILKINNIANECEKICEFLGNMDLLNKIKQIAPNTLKFVATNQSLYV